MALALQVLIAFVAVVAVSSLIGAGLGLLVRRLATGTKRARYARDLALAAEIILFLLAIPLALLALHLAVATYTWSNPWVHIPQSLSLLIQLPLSAAAVLVALRVERACAGLRSRERRGLCHSCGYDLRETAGIKCPECGATTSEHPANDNPR